ncbi:MAG: cyclodeaminase/cyclohydrolase family protein [Deltaproteobacteria bacterium]|jgi:formiminotetrahydrofolate cyclodeaminase|nr:cyclodeaminase/cyclohydrolase family protein [Deltaproteobacteria bacterium]MDH3927771.1 cyclodeaminase/cyclohydrolase family protein [Deltaproteobacteria bacterium]
MHDSFLEALARPEPVPGGGAAAAHGACVGLALLEKIVLVELRRSDIPSESRWQNLLEEVRKASTTLLRLRDEDGEAYVRFAQARTFGKGAEEILDLLKQAIESPIAIMKEAKRSLDLVARAGNHCKGHLLSDLLVVCELLRAAIDGNHRVAQANLGVMGDPSLRSHYQNKLNQVQVESRELFRSVEGDILERAKINKE